MTIRLGIIGLGWVFHNFHLPYWEHIRDVQVVAVCDIRRPLAEKVAGLFGAAVYDDPEMMLEQAELDALYLLLPPSAHGKLESLAIQRQIPFFIEKPLALDLDIARRIDEDVRRAGLITSVGYHRRYTWAVDKMRELLGDRTPALIHGSWFSVVPPIDWWGQKALSGGQLVEQATHMIDLFRYFFGDVRSVVAQQSHRLLHQANFDVADSSSVLFHFENGALGSLAATCAMPAGHHRIMLQMVVDQRSLEFFEENVYLHSATGTEIFRAHATPDWNPYVREGNAFFDAVRSGDPAGIRSSYADALQTLKLSLAARSSAETGQAVDLQAL